MNHIEPVASIADIRTVKCKLCSRVVLPSVFATHLASCGPRHADQYAKLAPEGLALPSLPPAPLPVPTLYPLPSSSSSPGPAPLAPLPSAPAQPNAHPLPALPLPPLLSTHRAQSPSVTALAGTELLNIEDDEDDPEDAPILPVGMAMAIGSPPLSKPTIPAKVPLPDLSIPLPATSGSSSVPAEEAAATAGAAPSVNPPSTLASSTTTAKPTKKRKGSAKTDDLSASGPPSKKAKPGETTSGTTKFKKTGPVDLDRQCGVILQTGEPCRRSITCKNHSIGAKRGVPGRSQSYDVLFELYKGNQRLEKDAQTRAAAAADALAELPALPDKTPDEEGADIMDAIKRLQPGPLVTRRPLWHMARPLFGVLDSIREAVRSAQGQLLAAGVAPMASTTATAVATSLPQQQ